MISFFQKMSFIKSCFDLKQLPIDEGCEIVMIGRSNVGKSTIINTISYQKNLARTSKTPGRTQCLNVYLSDEFRLIDAPGYGYAKVSVKIKNEWIKLLDSYFDKRRSLVKVFFVMDARHPLKENDQQWLDLMYVNKKKVFVILNKVDCLSKLKRSQVKSYVEGFCRNLGIDFKVLLISCTKNIGINELREEIISCAEK